ncbi:hypothetical protein [Sphingomonas radiodurans]|nr:hypothetical protein [Sphingomonas radiodurans]WBH15296.1 hypothetical protein LLW23_10610 [Sphingomonas radiodurans]
MTRAGEKLYHPDFVGTVPRGKSALRGWRWIAAAMTIWLAFTLHD